MLDLTRRCPRVATGASFLCVCLVLFSSGCTRYRTPFEVEVQIAQGLSMSCCALSPAAPLSDCNCRRRGPPPPPPPPATTPGLQLDGCRCVLTGGGVGNGSNSSSGVLRLLKGEAIINGVSDLTLAYVAYAEVRAQCASRGCIQ